MVWDNSHEKWMMKLGPEKTLRPQMSEGIPLPKYLGKCQIKIISKMILGELLLFFKTEIRPVLSPKRSTEGLWINNKGGCIGKLH